MQRFIAFFKNKYMVAALVFASVFTLGFTTNTRAVHSDNCDPSNTINGQIPASPAFNIWQLTFDPNQNCHDLPLIDLRNSSSSDSRDSRYAQNQSEHDQGINAQPNDTVEVSLYFHNGATDNESMRSQTTANGVTVSSNVDTNSPSQRHEFSGSISAANAQGASSASAGGNSFVNTSTPTTVQYVPGSTALCIGYDAAVDRGLNPSQYQNCGIGVDGRQSVMLPMPDGIVNGGVNIGDIKACFPFSGFVLYKVQLVGQAVTPPPTNQNTTLQITKNVSNTTTGSGMAMNANAQPNDHLSYQIIVTNIGSSTANNVSVVDQGVNGIDANLGSLPSGQSLGNIPAGQSQTITYDASVSGSALSGQYFNTARAQADNASQVSAQASVNVTVQTVTPPPTNQNTTLSISKTVANITTGSGQNSQTNASPNDNLSYRIVVTNTGSSTAHNVVVRDQGVNGIDANLGTLSSGQQLGDINAGSSQTVTYSANVSSSAASGQYLDTAFAQADNASQVSAQASVSVTAQTVTPPPQNQNTTLQITKNVSNTTVNRGPAQSVTAFPNDNLSYQITVTNTGSAVAHNVIVKDQGVSGINASLGSLSTGQQIGDLQPGAAASINYIASVASWAQAGTYLNTAFAQADNASQVSAQASVQVTVQAPPSRGVLSIVKVVSDLTASSGYSHTAFANQGDRVAYKVTVYNSGTVDLTNVVVHDTGGQNLNFDSNAGSIRNGISIGTLAVGQSKEFNYNATVNVPQSTSTTTITNTATATASNADQAQDSAQVIVAANNPQPQNTTLSITKMVSDQQRGINYATNINNVQNGDTVNFQIVVKNTGSVIAHNVVISDALPNNQVQNTNNIYSNLFGSGYAFGDLAPGQSNTIVFSAQVNISAGTIVNTAYAHADNAPQVSAQASIIVINPQGALTITKKVRDVTSGGLYDFSATAQPGDTISYLVTVANTSNVTLNNVIVNDSGVSGINFSNTLPTNQNIGNLTPGASNAIVYTGVLGSNTATTLPNTATAKADNAPQVSASAVVNVRVIPPPSQNAALSITKTVRDIAAGQSNYATSVNNAHNGDMVDFQITLTNTSSVTAHNVVLKDVFPNTLGYITGLSNSDAQALFNGSGITIGDMAAGQSTTYTFTAIINLPSGTITNVVNATASNANSVSASATIAIINLPPQNGSLSITKQVRNLTQNTSFAKSTTAQTNDTVSYTITVTNTSGITLTNVVLNDSGANGISVSSGLPTNKSLGNLNAGQAVPVTYTGTVTAGSGTLINTATVKADNANPASDSATVTVNNPQPPQNNYSFTLTKGVRDTTQGQSAYSTNTNVFVNDQLTYQIEFKNTGNATLNNVQLTDNTPAGITINQNSLGISTGNISGSSVGSVNLGNVAAGQDVIINYTAQVTANASGSLTNIVTATTSNAPTQTAQATVNVISQPQFGTISITKFVKNLTQNNQSFTSTVSANPGDRVAYQIQVTASNGNATNVTLNDTFPSNITFVNGTARLNSSVFNNNNSFSNTTVNLGNLSAGQTFTVYYEANVNSNLPQGQTVITNTATASADHQGTVSASASVIVNVNISQGFNQLSISKMVENLSYGTVLAKNIHAFQNDRVAFVITVTNTGSNTLNNVSVTDSMGSGLNFASGTIKLGNASFADGLLSGGNISLGSMSPGQQQTIYFETTVNAPAQTTVQNTAYAVANNTPQVQDSAFVFVGSQVLGSNVNLQLSKSAINQTKNIDATAIPASKEDYILYTLTAVNTGNSAATNYVFSDDLTNVLNYATMVDTKGGNMNGSVISWPPVTIPAGGSVQQQFRVRVNFFLPSNVGGLNLINTFGNTVTIQLQNPTVLGITFVAPKTGVTATLGFVFALMLTFAFAFFQKKGYLQALLAKLPKVKIQ